MYQYKVPFPPPPTHPASLGSEGGFGPPPLPTHTKPPTPPHCPDAQKVTRTDSYLFGHIVACLHSYPISCTSSHCLSHFIVFRIQLSPTSIPIPALCAVHVCMQEDKKWEWPEKCTPAVAFDVARETGKGVRQDNKTRYLNPNLAVFNREDAAKLYSIRDAMSNGMVDATYAVTDPYRCALVLLGNGEAKTHLHVDWSEAENVAVEMMEEVEDDTVEGKKRKERKGGTLATWVLIAPWAVDGAHAWIKGHASSDKQSREKGEGEGEGMGGGKGEGEGEGERGGEGMGGGGRGPPEGKGEGNSSSSSPTPTPSHPTRIPTRGKMQT